MFEEDQSEHISQKTFSEKARYGINRFRSGVRSFFEELPSGMRWALLALSLLISISWISLFISERITSSPSKSFISKDSVAKQASSRLHALVAEISGLRDTVARDSIFIEKITKGASPAMLFETIYALDSLRQPRFSDILAPIESDKNLFLKGRGIAYFDATKHLIAWNSARIGTTNFDSIFSYVSLLEKRSKMVLLDNEQIFSWVVAIRKLISKEGSLLGYVISKAMIGERFSLGGADDHPVTIFDDIIMRSGRDVRFFFLNAEIDSANSKDIYPVYLDPGDSSSTAGFLSIGNTQQMPQTALQNTLLFIRDFAVVLFIFLLIWLVCWHVAQSAGKNPVLSSKVFSLASIFFLLTSGRLLLIATGALSNICPKILQDSQDFAFPDFLGLLSDPLQLFSTILFFTSFLALSWIVFVPVRPEWKVSFARNEEETTLFSTVGWLIKIISILCAILIFPALNYLLATVCNILIANGSYHFLGNRFGFTRGAFTILEASFLLVGVSYFFSAIMLLLWILRAIIRLTASELSPTRSYIAHYILFTIIVTTLSWLLSPNISSIYPEIYWPIITFALCVVVVIVFSRDIALLRIRQQYPSFFYRIPRSGLALLFLLSGAGFLLSPLMATQEYSNDIDIIKQNLRQNAHVNDLTYSSFLDQILLTLTSGETSRRIETSSDIKNLAFNIWLKEFPESANRSFVIEIQDLQGKTLSHFAQNTTIEDEDRLAKIRDSLITILTTQNKKSISESSLPPTKYVLGTQDCFTQSCTPASLGVGYLSLSGIKGQIPRRLDSLAGSKLLISITIWNDLFPQAAVHSLYDIVRTAGASTDKLAWQDQDVYYAQYQNGSLKNSSTAVIDLPSHIPAEIDSALKKKEFVSREEYIDGNRCRTIYHQISDQTGSGHRILSATIVIPGIQSLLELTLSLNSVSLFIGFFVIFLALLLRSLLTKGKRGTLKFRDRIFLIVLTIALVPLVIVTNITRSLLVEREQRIEREHLQRDAEIISERLGRTLMRSDSTSNLRLVALLSDLSRTIGRDISYYNASGILFATNRPELYESSLLASQLSSDVLREILIRQKSFSIEPLSSASGSFDIGYKAIKRSANEALIGIVGVTSFRGIQIIEADIARTIELMYGAFSALGIILLLIGAWISVRVAAPIQQLILATEEVTEGNLETIVNIKRKDEVGELAQAFNRMTGELERTRENVAQSEREGAWKEMARQVAHEIKNPLTPMKLSVQHVEHAYETGDTNFGSVFKRVIRTLGEQIDVLTRIATEFSRFGEMPRRKYGFVSLRKIVESAMALYDAERGRIRFIIEIPKNLPPIYADDEEFRRALVNLIRNALQATEGWGVILISAREKKGLIHLTISDTGGGMSQETLKKAFDPNFSTKTSGMGLGLAIVKKIITDMSGTITVESTLGKGTTFHIELPAREYPPE